MSSDMIWAPKSNLAIWNRLSAVELAMVLAGGGELPANIEGRRRRRAEAVELIRDEWTSRRTIGRERRLNHKEHKQHEGKVAA